MRSGGSMELHGKGQFLLDCERFVVHIKCDLFYSI